jgi:hypothetical protein
MSRLFTTYFRQRYWILNLSYPHNFRSVPNPIFSDMIKKDKTVQISAFHPRPNNRAQGKGKQICLMFKKLHL